MAEGLNIVITAKLNETVSKGVLQEQLDRIAKGLQLKLSNIGIDESLAKTLKDLAGSLNNVKSIIDQNNRVLEQTVTITKELDGTIKKVQESRLADGTIIRKTTDDLRKQTDEIKKQEQEARKLASEFDNVGKAIKNTTVQNGSGQITKTSTTYQNGSTSTTVNADENGIVTSVKEIENIKQQELETQKLTESKEKLREKMLEIQQVGVISDGQVQKIYDGIDDSQNLNQIKLVEQEYSKLLSQQKEILNVQKAQYQVDKQDEKRINDLKLENEEIARQIELYKQSANNKITTLTSNRSLSGHINQEDLSNAKGEISGLNATNFSSLEEFRNKTQQINTQLQTLSANAKEARASVNPFVADMEHAVGKFATWLSAGTIVMQTFNWFKEGIQYVADYNKQLTLISTTTNDSQQKVQQLGKSFATTASQMGVLTENFTEGAAEFYRQQLGDAETLNRLQVATQYAKISNLDFGTSAKVLTAATNTIHEDIRKVSDVFTLLGDSTASSAQEIGVAFQKIGGEASSLGVPFEQTAAMIAELENRTREAPETIGTALKSIYARAESLKSKGFAADESGDITNVNQVSQALATIGVQLVDNQGQFRNFGDVLNEVGQKWSTLDSAHRRYIATVMAGTQQQSRFLVLMDNYKDAMSLTEKAMNSAGTTQQKYDLYLQGTEAHLNRLKDAGTNLWTDIFNSSSMKSGIDAIASVTNAVDGLVHVFGAGNTTVFAFALTLLLATNRGREIINTYGTISGAVSKLKTAYLSLTVAEEEATVASNTLRDSLLMIGKGTIIGLAITGITWILSEFIGKAMEASQAAEEFKQKQDEVAQNWSQNGAQLQSLSDKYNQLSQEKTRNTEQEQEYIKVQQELSQLMPSMVDHIDAEGNAHLKNADAIDKEIQKMREAAIEKAKSQKLTLQSDYKNNEKTITDENVNIADYEKQISYLESKKDDGNTSLRYQGRTINIDHEIASLNAKIQQSQSNAETAAQKNSDAIKTQLDGVLSLTDGYSKLDDETIKYLNDKEKSVSIKDFDKNGNLDQKKSDELTTIVAINGELQDPSVQNKSYEQKVQMMKDLTAGAQQAGLSIDWLNSLFSRYLNLTNDSGQATYDFSAASEQLSSMFDDTFKKTEGLNSAIDKLNNGQKLSYNEIQQLIKANPDLSNAWTIQNGQMTISVEALKKVRDARIDDAKTALQTKQQEIEAGAKALQEQLKISDQTIASIQDVASARIAAQQVFDDITKNSSSDDIHGLGTSEEVLSETSQKVSQQFEELGKIRDQIKNMSTGYDSNMNFDTTADSASSATRKLTELENSINGVDNALADLQNRMEGINQHSAEYRQGLQQEIDLLDKKKGLLQQQINNPSAGWSDLSGAPSNVITSSPVSSKSFNINALDGALSGHAQDFINAGNKYGIDPILLAAIAMHETGNGTSSAVLNLNNAGGLMGANGLQSFSSLKDSIDEMGATLSAYAKQGKTSVQAISQIYAPIGADNDPNGLNKNWVGGVNSFYSQLTNGGTPASSNVDDITKKVADHIQQAKSEISKLNTQEQQLRLNIVKDMIGQYQDVSAEYDDKIKLDQTHMQSYDKSSKEYVSAINDQINALKERQYVTHATADYIRGTQFANTPEMKKQIRDLQQQYVDFDEQIKKLKQDALDSNLDFLDSKIGDIDLGMKKLDVTIQANKDKKFGYNSDLTSSIEQQIGLMQQKQAIYQQEADAIKNSGLLTEDNIKKMEELQGSILDMQSQIEQKQKEIADSIVAAMKNAIQQEIKAEDERHQEVTKNLDAEAKQYEDQINAQIKAIDNQKSTEDYNYNLKKEQDARQKIQDQLNALAMDKSDDAKSKRADLTKQLTDENDKIDKMQKDRETELRKQNLQDQLDKYKKDIDAKKQAEDDKYDATKNKLQDQLDDEQHWADMTKQIMNGSVSDVQSEMKKLIDGLDSYATSNASIVNAHINTIKSSIEELKKVMGDLNGVSVTNGSSGGSGSAIDSIKQRIAQLGQLWQTAAKQSDKDYYHVQAVELASQNGGIWNSGTNTYDWVDKSKISLNQVKQVISQLQDAYKIAVLQTDKDQLHNIASQLASLYGGKYTDSGWVFPSTIAQAADGAELPMWGSGGKAMIVHQGEIIHNQEDSKSLKSVFSLTKRIADALVSKGGSLLSGIAQGMGLDNISASMIPAVATPSTLNPSNFTFNNQKTEGDNHVTNYIDLTMHVKDGTDAASKLVNGLQKLGLKFNTR